MLKGKLERVEGSVLVGWVWDTQSIQPVSFRLFVNDIPYGDYVADLSRGDLIRNGIGDGAHAFRVTLEPHWLKAGDNKIMLVEKFQQLPLSRSMIHHVPVLTSTTKPWATTNESEQSFAAPRLPAIASKRPLRARSAETKLEPRLNWEEFRASTRTLIQLGKLGEKQVGSMIETAFIEKRYEEACILGEASEEIVTPSYRILNNLGRAYLQIGQVDRSVEVLLKLRSIDDGRHGALFFLARAYLRQQNLDQAYEVLQHCISCKPDEAKYHLEAGRTAVLKCFGAYGVFDEDPKFLEPAIAHMQEAARLDPQDFKPWRELAPLLVHANRLSEAYEAANRATELGPKQAAAWTELMKTYLRQGRIDEALQASETALSFDKNSDGAKFSVRILRRLASCKRPDDSASLLLVGNSISGAPADSAWLPRAIDVADDGLEDLLLTAPESWILFNPPAVLTQQEMVVFEQRAFPWAAGVEIMISGVPAIAWRRDFLLAIIHSKMPGGERLSDLLLTAKAVGLVVPLDGEMHALEPSKKNAAKVALLISQYGIYKFGGAEQFLEQMARIYLDLGYRVVMVGTRQEHVGEQGIHNGLEYTFVEGSPEELFRLAVEEEATIVHVVSGLGFESATAMRYLKTRLVFGIHFWRELFYNPTPSSGYFPDIDRTAVARPDFKIILDDFASIYSNSTYTRGVVERHFGLLTPVIYSLPDNVEPGPVPAHGARDIVLLANARADKGYKLMLDIAAELPHVRFLAIASQSGLTAAQRALTDRGIENVELLPRVDVMSDLYKRARVVLVPSFRFVETFSRVVIEAHRFGAPVIGSDRGNVPHLLTEGGFALAEDAKTWAKEIDALWLNEGYWNERSAEAFSNSERYTFSNQKDRLSGVISSVTEPFLIGVGSGLGNVIHTTPVIRNIARRLGRRIDVVVAGDYADLLFVAAHQEYVNHVFLLNDVVLRRRYDTVFLTHSFGNIVPNFASPKVLSSRDWDNFAADHLLHEAEFNLAAAASLLDIPYEPEDVSAYYLGELTYTRPEKTLVGFHGGSKDGVWATKRWPGYARLAAELTKRGIPVASFGTASEYVEGTIDMTGGTIEEMATRMLACSVFVANDSGVMNIANALGIPLIALFAPTNALTRGPLAVTSLSIAVEKPCSPCEMHPTERQQSFMRGTCKCIAEIDVVDVLKSVIDRVAI